MNFYGNDDYQNYLVFPPKLYALIQDDKIVSWQSTGVSSQRYKPTDSILSPTV